MKFSILNFKNIKRQISDYVLLGYGDYLSKSIPLDLFQTVNIKIDPSQGRIGEANAKKS